MHSKEGQGFCWYLPAGKAMANIVGTTVSYVDCDAGTFRLPGFTGCADCPAGHYCPNIDKGPIPCKPGTYKASSGKNT
jgi:hypothetical protein